MDKSPFYLIFLLILSVSVSAQTITGRVTNQQNEALSFASITIKGTTSGVAANTNGTYVLHLPAGTYTLVCGHVGYQTTEKTVTVSQDTTSLDFQLSTISYSLQEVVVKNGGEDPAYAIIRNAIRKRPEYEKELHKFQCSVYIKGRLQLRNYPTRFLGQPVDFGDGDTSKKKIIFLSETEARYSVDQQHAKVEVLSTRVSGNSDGYGFSIPQIISFYNNNIQIGRNLNPRGFISPIADHALNDYNYHFAGSFFDKGIMINRIRVIPKRKFEPLFNGYIDIMENSWRIYSVQLTLLKENALQVLDTLSIEQTYLPYHGTWVIKQQVIYPSVNLLGFDGFGDFVQVYDHFNFAPRFPRFFFDQTLLKFDDSAQKKSAVYWDSIRPVPLQPAEIADYQKKDSLELKRKDPRYLDSVDRHRNRINLMGVLLTGQEFNRETRHFSLYEPALINLIDFNTVEGLVFTYNPEFQKSWGKNQLSLIPVMSYGFSNRHFNAHLTGSLALGGRYPRELFFSGGQRVFQFNNDQPQFTRSNTALSLIFRENFMKLYQARFARLGFRQGIGQGLTLTGTAEFQDRSPLVNTSDYTWARKTRPAYTPNYPFEISNSNIPPHKALSARLDISWQPGARYIAFPDRNLEIGSKYPTIHGSITQGIANLLGSDVNYTKWSLGATGNINLKIAGSFRYHVKLGGFLNTATVYTPDYTHYMANRDLFATGYLNGFQLMYYYQFSNIARLYTEAHMEYHLNGILSNKIPVIKKLNWFFVIGANGLHISNSQYYYECFFSVENIFRIGRVDFVQAFLPGGARTSGITISLAGLLQGHKQE